MKINLFLLEIEPSRNKSQLVSVNILKRLRNYCLNVGELPLSDISFLKKMIKTKTMLFALCEFLQLVPSLPNNFLDLLLHLAIDLRNHYLHSKIIESCIRLYGFEETTDQLHQIFIESDDSLKKIIVDDVLYHTIDDPFIWDEKLQVYDVDSSRLGVNESADLSKEFKAAIELFTGR